MDTTSWLQNPIFAAGGVKACELLSRTYQADSYPAGELIVREGEEVEYVHIVLQGTLRAFHRVPDGREVLVMLLRSPAIIGDVELFNGRHFLCSVAVMDYTQVAHLPAEEYLAFIKQHPNAMLKQLQHLTQLSTVISCFERHALASTEERMANIFLSYAKFFQEKKTEEIKITYPITQDNLAQSLAIARRSVANVMAKWQHERIKSKSGSNFIIYKPTRMAELSNPIGGTLCYQMGEISTR